MFNGYKISVDESHGMIVSELASEFGGEREQIWRQVINTNDKMIRDKLIALGWTPPPADRQKETPDLSDRG